MGDRRARGGVHRRVQHPRRARDDDAGRAGDHLQRSRHTGDRDEQRRQRARPGQPRQLDDRSRGAARRPQRRRRTTRRGRSCHARQPGQDRLLLRRGRADSPWTSLAVSRGFAAGVDTVTVFAGEGPRASSISSRDPDQLATRSPRACAPCTTRSCRSASTRSSSSVPSTPGSSPTPAGTATASSPSCTRGCRSPAARLVRGAGGMAEGVPESLAELDAAEVPPATASCSSTPAAAPACSRRSSAAGRTVRSGAHPSPGGRAETKLDP